MFSKKALVLFVVFFVCSFFSGYAFAILGDTYKAALLVSNGKLEEAEAVLREMISDERTPKEDLQVALVYSVLVQLADGRTEDADASLARLVSIDPDMALEDIVEIFPELDGQLNPAVRERFSKAKRESMESQSQAEPSRSDGNECDLETAVNVLREQVGFAGTVDDVGDVSFKAALKNFQLINGLERTGVLDAETCGLLKKME